MKLLVTLGDGGAFAASQTRFCDIQGSVRPELQAAGIVQTGGEYGTRLDGRR